MKKAILVIIIASALVFFYSITSYAEDYTFENISEITNTEDYSSHSDVSNGNVTWQYKETLATSHGSDISSIYLYDTSLKQAFKIADGVTDNMEYCTPRISGDNVVFKTNVYDGSAFSHSVIAYNIPSNTFTTIKSGGNEQNIDISGNTVVWSAEDRSMWSENIYSYNLLTQQMEQITSSSLNVAYVFPDVSGDKITFLGMGGASGPGELFLYNPQGGGMDIKSLTYLNNPGYGGYYATEPRIDGEYIVYSAGMPTEFNGNVYLAYPTPVPEPSTLLLIGFGGIITACIKRRRKA